MLAILNSLNAHNLPIFQPILIILVPKFMVHRSLSDKTYLLLGLLSPLIMITHVRSFINEMKQLCLFLRTKIICIEHSSRFLMFY